MDGTGDMALSYTPDIVLFQEVDTDSTRSHHVDEAELLTDKFDAYGTYDSVFAQNYHSAYLMYPVTRPHGASNSGLLTESRFDITSSLRRSLPIATGFKKILDLDRCYSISRISVENGRELIVINIHLSACGTDAALGNEQLECKCTDYAGGMVSSTRYTNIPYSEDSFTVILDGFIVSDKLFYYGFVVSLFLPVFSVPDCKTALT